MVITYILLLYGGTPMATKPSKNYINLCNEIPDLEENILRDKIKVIPLPRNSKAPFIPNWNTRKYDLTESFRYKNKKGRKFTQNGLKYHTGNYGILIGYNNNSLGYSIGCIDIDGYTLNTKDKTHKARIKKETQKLIYEALKDLPNSLQVKTQSGGYHLYFWTKATQPNTSITSKSLYFPNDFKIPELAGKCLVNSIEIFTNEERKQTVLPSSTIYDKATKEIREYKVISTVNKFSDIEVLDDLNQTVINHLTSKGYTYKPVTQNSSNNTPSQSKTFTKTGNSNNESNLLQLTKKEINQVVKLVTPIFTATEGAKHTTALYLGGYFSYHITKDSSSKIANGIVRKIGKLMNDTNAFKHTLLQNYEDKDNNKAGLPKLCNHILTNDKTFNVNSFSDKLNSICNPNFSKELVGDFMVNDNKIPIYLYEDEVTKWLKYEGIFTKIDLILNLNTQIGSFKNSKTDKEITSFNYKFDNKHFELKKKDLESINYFLSTENERATLPKYFTEMVRTSLNNLDKFITAPKELSTEVKLKTLLKQRANIEYARKELGNYLHQNGTILRRGINTPYIKNNNNGYDSVDIDDIMEYLYNSGDFETNTIHTDDITKALGFISERVKPSYNIVKFPNCLYDIKNFKVLETPEKPILTLTEVQYNYNPEAKGKLIVEFLETSLKQPDDTPEELQERVQSVYEFIGYLLTSGNPLNAWFIITGIGGAGKGVFTRLIISIFGYEKVGDLKLQELTPENKFSTAHLESKVINIVRDSPKKPIEDTGMLKAITGYDDIGIEHKGQDKYILPKEEVPDMVTVCNNVPRFKEGFDESILQRAIIFEFLNQFRGTDNENTHLEEDILSNPEELEYLIFQSIQAYKTMVQSGKDFKARINKDKTMELLGKHTDPLSYILPILVKYNHRAEEDGEEYILTDELNKLIVFVGKKLGLNITGLTKDGLIKPVTLINKIKREFNLDKEYKTEPKAMEYNQFTRKYEYKRIYPNLCKTPEYDEYLKEMEDNKTE